MNSRFHKRPGRGMRQQERCAAGLSHPRDWSQAGLEEVAACALWSGWGRQGGCSLARAAITNGVASNSRRLLPHRSGDSKFPIKVLAGSYSLCSLKRSTLPCPCEGLRWVVSDSLWPHGLYPARPLCPWGFSRQECWGGLPRLPPGDLSNPGSRPRAVSSSFWHLPVTLGISSGFPGSTEVKNPPDKARDSWSFPGLGPSPGGGNGDPLQ